MKSVLEKNLVMAEVYKIIHPVKYFEDIINQKVRPDGRSFFDARNLKITVESIQTAEGSAIVKCGNTTVVCGIQLELATPKAGEPDVGFLITNVELPPLCSSKYRPGPPSDQAQITSQIVSDIITNSKCIDLKDLCIVSDKLAWVVYCDIVCLNNDGSLVDACLMSLMASLKTLSFPHVSYNSETEEINVDKTIRTPLKISGLPVATSFSIYTLNGRNNILTDPTAYEEDMCGGIGANLIICYNDDMLCGIQKFGGNNLTSDCQEKSIKIAFKRAKLVKEVINTCLKNLTNK